MDFAGVANPDGRRCSGQQRFVVDAHSATGILLTAPALVLLSATVLYPIAVTFWLSIHGKDFAVTHRGPLVGFDNYARVFASSDFQNALANTVGFVIAAIILEAVIALPVALALDRGLRGTQFFQAVIALPLMVAPVVGALAWRWMFADAYGVIDSIATALGGKGPLWFSNVWLARATRPRSLSPIYGSRFRSTSSCCWLASSVCRVNRLRRLA